MSDRETLSVYDQRAGDYAACASSDGQSRHLTAFMESLPNGARVLDLGCGPGAAARHMAQAGLNVDAWDASAEMVKLAAHETGAYVKQASFEALKTEAAYDGIYANFSLLHAPKTDMPGHLARISRALKPGGVFHIGMKTGTGEARDPIGRFYAYYEVAELIGLLADVGLSATSTSRGREIGLAGTEDPWVILLAKKHD